MLVTAIVFLIWFYRVRVNAGELSEAINQVTRAASRDEARPILTGVLLEISREGLRAARRGSMNRRNLDLIPDVADTEVGKECDRQ